MQLHSNQFIPIAGVFASDSEGSPIGDPVTDAVYVSSDPNVITVKTNDSGGRPGPGGPD